jgi:C4-type Zn-finger protein
MGYALIGSEKETVKCPKCGKKAKREIIYSRHPMYHDVNEVTIIDTCKHCGYIDNDFGDNDLDYDQETGCNNEQDKIPDFDDDIPF